MSRTAEAGVELQEHPRASLKQLRRAWLHYDSRYGQRQISADLGVFGVVQAESLRHVVHRYESGPINLDSTRQLQRCLSSGSKVVQVLQELEKWK